MAEYLIQSETLEAIGEAIRAKEESSDPIPVADFAARINALGAGLNFAVVGGTTQPADPKENTIWVSTDVEITSWILSATEPAEPAEGMVWISTDTASESEFNALKKNALQVCPRSAKQYVSGAWGDVDMKIYQDGAWGETFSGLLYDSGNEYADFTGSWISVGLDAYLSEGSDGWEYYAKAPTLTKNASSMTVEQKYSSTFASGIARTSNLINLTSFSALNFTGKSNDSENWCAYLCILPENATEFSDAVASTNIGATSKTYSIDVSSLDGSYYVALFVCADSELTSVTVTVNKVWLT